MFLKTRKLIFLLVIVVLLTTAISACSTSKSDEIHLYMLPLNEMPAEVQSAPVAVQEAYQFTSINSDIMKDIPAIVVAVILGTPQTMTVMFQVWARKTEFLSIIMLSAVPSAWILPRMSCACYGKGKVHKKPRCT